MRDVTDKRNNYLRDTDVQYLMYGDDAPLHLSHAKATEVATAVAYCRYFHVAVVPKDGFIKFGLTNKEHAMRVAAQLVAELKLTGLKTKSAMSLRHKLDAFPAFGSQQAQCDFMVNKQYGNDNRRIVGKNLVVDKETGEQMTLDIHKAVMFALWMNIGRANKEYKLELHKNQYLTICKQMDVKPVSYRTFCGYTDELYAKITTARERHGAKAFNNMYKTYCPALRLEFSDSLWVGDGSGTKLKYKDGTNLRTLYMVRIHDVASRYLLGYHISIAKKDPETAENVLLALEMAIETSGGVVPLDFLSDNGSAWSGADVKSKLTTLLPKVRNISAGNSQENPAENMVKAFTEMGRSLDNWSNTGFNAHSLEHQANADYLKDSALPNIDAAYRQMVAQVERWNTTKGADGYSPQERYEANRNPNAPAANKRAMRYAFGRVTRLNLTTCRGFVQPNHNGIRHSFEIPNYETAIADISRALGYKGQAEVQVRWNNSGADLYTPEGAFILGCLPTDKTHKSTAEATDQTLSAMGRLAARKRAQEAHIDTFTEELKKTIAVIANDTANDTDDMELLQYDDYCASTGGAKKKAGYNDLMERAEAEAEAKATAKVQSKIRDTRTPEQIAADDF